MLLYADDTILFCLSTVDASKCTRLLIFILTLTCSFSLFAEEPERVKTQCEHHRDSVQTTSPEGYPIVGAYVPQCDANGQYRSLQVSDCNLFNP